MTQDSNSLLAHLAWKLTNQTETLATEALGYILSRSTPARAALREMLSPGGADVGPIAKVATEVIGEENERVDLVGFDEQGDERALIEVKFWAGLTENQPVTYLKRLLTDGKPAVLVFVAPRARLETLWPEVLRLATNAGFNLTADTSVRASEFRSAVVDESERRMMLTSWSALLDSMSSRARKDGDPAAVQDILQLDALCEREDATAFLPLHSEEFGPEFPRRMLNLQQLVDDATNRGRQAGIISTQGLQMTPKPHGYGRYMWLGTKGRALAWLGVNYLLWAAHRETPLWLTFWASDKSTGELIVELRRKTELLVEGDDSTPIYLPTSVESDAVLDAVVARLEEVAEKVSEVLGADGP